MAEAIELMEGLSDANQSDPEQGIKSADTTSDDETNSPKSTARRSLEYSWKLFKLGKAAWMIGDISSDVVQTRSYYLKSPYWNTNHECLKEHETLLPTCEELVLSEVYFSVAVSVWFFPPLVLLLYICVGLMTKYPKERFLAKWKQFINEDPMLYMIEGDGEDQDADHSCVRHHFFCVLANVYILMKVVLVVLTLPVIGVLFSFFIIYLKLPFDALRLALADLGWIPRRWARWGKIQFLEFSTVDMKTNTDLLKFFELFGEAVPQLALAMTYYLKNKDMLEESIPFLDIPFPTTITSIVLSSGSIFVGIITGLLAVRKFIAGRLDQKGWTPLHYATSSGNVRKVKSLIKSGARVDAANHFGDTALIMAAESGQLQVVQLLVDAGAQVDVSNINGNTAIIVAAKEGHLSVVQYLISAGAQFDDRNVYGESPLYEAARSGHHDVVKFLIDSGARLDTADRNGNTPLNRAAGRGNTKDTELLISAGANLELANVWGWTPLMEAAHFGNSHEVELLIKAGARLDTTEVNGKTALNLAEESPYAKGKAGLLKLLTSEVNAV